MKGRYLNFGVFSLFDDQSFLQYLKATLEIKFLLFPQIFLYPSHFDIFAENCILISELFLE